MLSYSTPEHIARPEPMGPHFTKFHLPGALLHRFTEARDEHPHSHPWGFTTHILSGGYVEDVYTIHHNGTFTFERFERHAGTSHRVEATTIHRLVALIGPECWTLVEPEPWQQHPGFYRFEGAGVWYRQWDEPEFRRLTA